MILVIVPPCLELATQPCRDVLLDLGAARDERLVVLAQGRIVTPQGLDFGGHGRDVRDQRFDGVRGCIGIRRRRYGHAVQYDLVAVLARARLERHEGEHQHDNAAENG